LERSCTCSCMLRVYLASVSEPHLMVLTCEPLTVSWSSGVDPSVTDVASSDYTHVLTDCKIFASAI